MNTNKPQVSVIVTTYNREKYLKETIQSILDQTFTDFELIVVDNFSNYDFFELIESFNDDRIRAFQNQNNGIIAVNRNYGISKATGKYLAFCDDDDLWMQNKLEVQFKLAKMNPKMIISSSFIEIDDCSNVVRIHKLNDYKKPFEIYCENLTTLSSVLLLNSGEIYFDTDQNLMTIEDYALWIQLYHKGYKLHVIQEPLIKYRISSESTFYRPKNIENIAVRKIYLCSKMYLLTQKLPLKVYMKIIIKNLKILIITTIKNGKFKKILNRL